YDANRNVQIRHIRYLSKKYAVLCVGASPGLIECIWGAEGARVFLAFNSDNLKIAIPYISQLIERGLP
ncbi:MAG: hypothetical protein ACKO96_19360, partial [Flammeovirgaceae bacterium]